MAESQDCRSEEGITVGLVDAIISILRVLAPRDLCTTNVQEALADLSEDPDFRTVCTALAPRQVTASWSDEKTDAEPDSSGWTANENAEFEERYGVQAAMRLRAANDRVWAIVQELRSEAVKDGRDPYQDPMARRLSAALVGVDDA